MHKGLVRVMIPKAFHSGVIDSSRPANHNAVYNSHKEWVKAVNTIELMKRVDQQSSGIECDIYISPDKKYFNVHHDNSMTEGVNLDSLLAVYHSRGLQASLWLDLKNLRDSNYTQALTELVRLRSKYSLAGKLLVESNRVNFLKSFSDSGFYTSYYTALFNPYTISEDSQRYWVNHISDVLHKSSVNAISGSYYQYPFLHRFFPNYPILLWSPNDRFSIINWWFKQRIATDDAVYIVLYP
jgi:hypothetical protein